MNKFLWGTSQGLTSAFFFLLQLFFLKDSDLRLMVLFSTLFALMNFFLLATRRSLIEINAFKDEVPSISATIKISMIFGIFCIPLLIIIVNRPLVIALMTLFLFNQIILDFLRFSNDRNHKIFIIIQFTFGTFAILLMFFRISPLNSFTIIVWIQFMFCICYSMQDKRTKLNKIFLNSLFSFSRFLDFTLNSGFGFLLPFLVYIFLDSPSVGELRTSQSFLSLGNIFTASMYYSTLDSNKSTKVHWSNVFVPSVILLATLAVIYLFLTPTIVNDLFGPFFYDSIFLTIILIVALAPIMWNSRESAKLVKAQKYKLLLGIHFISLLTLAFGSCFGFLIFGILAYGVFTVVSNLVEIFLVHKVKRKFDVV